MISNYNNISNQSELNTQLNFIKEVEYSEISKKSMEVFEGIAPFSEENKDQTLSKTVSGLKEKASLLEHLKERLNDPVTRHKIASVLVAVFYVTVIAAIIIVSIATVGLLPLGIMGPFILGNIIGSIADIVVKNLQKNDTKEESSYYNLRSECPSFMLANNFLFGMPGIINYLRYPWQRKNILQSKINRLKQEIPQDKEKLNQYINDNYHKIKIELQNELKKQIKKNIPRRYSLDTNSYKNKLMDGKKAKNLMENGHNKIQLQIEEIEKLKNAYGSKSV